MIFMAVGIAKPIYTDPEYIDEMSDYHPVHSDPERAVKQWEKMFSHPLLVSQIELVVQPNNRRISFFRGESRPETAASRRRTSMKKMKTEEMRHSGPTSRINVQLEESGKKLPEIIEEEKKEDEDVRPHERNNERNYETSPNLGQFTN